MARARRTPAAGPLGEHEHQGPPFPRYPLRRGADRARDRRYDPTGNYHGVRRPRSRTRRHARRRTVRGAAVAPTSCARGDQPRKDHRRSTNRGCRAVLGLLRTPPPVACDEEGDYPSRSGRPAVLVAGEQWGPRLRRGCRVGKAIELRSDSGSATPHCGRPRPRRTWRSEWAGSTFQS